MEKEGLTDRGAHILRAERFADQIGRFRLVTREKALRESRDKDDGNIIITQNISDRIDARAPVSKLHIGQHDAGLFRGGRACTYPRYPIQYEPRECVAEEVGFEPTVDFHLRRFSRPVH